jgi:hypothetical protein
MIAIDELMESLTVLEIEQFITSKFWRIVEGTIKERLEVIRTMLERGEITYQDGGNVVTRPATFEDLKSFQGDCRSLRWILKLPEILKEDKIQKVKKEAE